MRSSGDPDRLRFVTRSRRGDLLLLALVASLMLGFAGRLAVYHEVPRWAEKRAAERVEAPARADAEEWDGRGP